MFCWGNTVNGELGLGGIEEEHILIPKELSFSKAWNVTRVGCGENHTVLITSDGEVFTCGSNDMYQLGTIEKPRKRPGQVDALEAHVIRLVACGLHHTLVVNEWGQVFSWGHERYGQLGHGLDREFCTLPKMIRTLATKRVVQIACGAQHSLALTDVGELYSWGRNQSGQLGLGIKGGDETSTSEFYPSLIKSLDGVPLAQIACGSEHSMALSKSGAIFSWGKNTFGQLGLNDEKNRDFPTLLRTLRSQKVKYICCGEDHTAVLTKEGGVFTFGAGMYGQLGHGSTANEILPRKVLELMGSTVTQIACGRRHTLAYVPSRGRIYSFGLGGSGQLGINSQRNCNSPMVTFSPWVSPLAPQPMEEEENDTKLHYVVYRIFSGGDQCFVRVSLQKDEIPSDDYRLPSPLQQILTLTNDKAKEFVRVGSKQTVSQDLMSFIENTFSSSACINASFLLKHEEHYGCGRHNCGIDISDVRKFFHKISRIQNSVVMELVKGCIEKELVPRLNRSPPDVEALRVYVVLTECHLFNQFENFNSLLCPFGHALLSLKIEASRVLEAWWSDLGLSYLLNVLQVYKTCVVKLLDLPETKNEIEMMSRNRGLEVSLHVLEKVNRVNKDSGHVVPYENFYIPEITQKIDVRLDYLHWLQFDKLFPAHMGPRLFFCNYPFVFDAKAKSILLQTDADLQMQNAVDEAYRRNFTSLFMPIDPTNPYLILYVTRENIVQDTLMQLSKYGSTDFKKPLKIIFCGEDAVDAGGVRKEFFLLLLKEIVDPKYGMFKEYETKNIWFNEQSFEDDLMFHMIGILCGLAIYNGNIIPLPFPLVLYKKLLKETTKLDDLKDLMPNVVNGLQNLLNYEGDDVEEVFMLNFEITREAFGESVTTELKPGGSNLSVSKENCAEYVQLYVEYILNVSVERQFSAFNNGFHKVCGGRVLVLFHSQELMAMVIGNENYNWRELEESTEYKGDFTVDHPTIRLFWKVFHTLTLEQKKKFLLFLTGSDRIPIAGMKSIKLFIQSTGGGEDYLPVAHTCFNLLDLPLYTTEERLRSKLLQAIEHTQGFALV